MLEINKAHKITSKIQAFGPQILYKNIHSTQITWFKIKHNKAMIKNI